MAEFIESGVTKKVINDAGGIYLYLKNLKEKAKPLGDLDWCTWKLEWITSDGVVPICTDSQITDGMVLFKIPNANIKADDFGVVTARITIQKFDDESHELIEEITVEKILDNIRYYFWTTIIWNLGE